MYRCRGIYIRKVHSRNVWVYTFTVYKKRSRKLRFLMYLFRFLIFDVNFNVLTAKSQCLCTRVKCDIDAVSVNRAADILGHGITVTGNIDMCAERDDIRVYGNNAMTHVRSHSCIRTVARVVGTVSRRIDIHGRAVIVRRFIFLTARQHCICAIAADAVYRKALRLLEGFYGIHRLIAADAIGCSLKPALLNEQALDLTHSLTARSLPDQDG